MSDALAIFKCLGDPTRFAICALLARSDSYVELLAEKLSLTPGTISHHLKKLEEAGLVRCSRAQFYMIYALNRAPLEQRILDCLTIDDAIDDDTRYRDRVCAAFFRGSWLTALPTQQKKREIICAAIVEDFARDRRYSEDEVNAILEVRYGDHCALRRALVECGLMAREHKVYWRV